VEQLRAVIKPPRLILYVFFLLILTLLAGCDRNIPALVYKPWVFTDLRLLDSPDAPSPELDLIAAYLRTAGMQVELRLDFLDMPIRVGYDLLIAIDASPGAIPAPLSPGLENLGWDVIIQIPAHGTIRSTASNPEFQRFPIRILRDPELDMVEIGLPAHLLNTSGFNEPSTGCRIQILALLPDSTTLSDTLGPFPCGLASTARAPLALAFWNTYPAQTPAQALRRWDGAHTGPKGGRHGLYNLLRTARSHQMPITLLDLKDLDSLSALDFLGGLELVQELQKEKVLILPEQLSGIDPPGGSFSLTPTQIGYQQARRNHSQAPVPPYMFSQLPLGEPVVFSTGLIFPQRSSSGQAVLSFYSLPPGGSNPIDAFSDGITLAFRQILLQAALASQKQSAPGILPIAWELPASAWGDPQSARAAFRYLNLHPWIKVLNQEEIIAFLSQPLTSSTDNDFSNEDPNRHLGKQSTDANAIEYPLREITADWLTHPSQRAVCDSALAGDGQDQCYLANEQLIAWIEPQTGELTHLFANLTSFHQVIGSTNPSPFGQSGTQNSNLGSPANPDAMAGAFLDANGKITYHRQQNQCTSLECTLVLRSSDGIQKIYTLSDQSIEVKYIIEQAHPAAFQTGIAITPDPWNRFAHNWAEGYSVKPEGNRNTTIQSENLQIDVVSTQDFQTSSFLDTFPFASLQEDPNRDYPAGHYLQFPVFLISLFPQQNVTITLSVVERLP
jgi:hypothetical protein